MKAVAQLLVLLLAGTSAAQGAAPTADHHQHLLNASMAGPGQKPILAKDLVAMLDAAGIRRAVVLSNAFRYGDPRLPPDPGEYARVMAENDWTASEAAKYPQRLVAYCSFNPLKDYALGELGRCARAKRSAAASSCNSAAPMWISTIRSTSRCCGGCSARPTPTRWRS